MRTKKIEQGYPCEPSVRHPKPDAQRSAASTIYLLGWVAGKLQGAARHGVWGSTFGQTRWRKRCVRLSVECVIRG